MRSSTLSDTANRSRHGSTLCSPTVEKILCRSPIVSALWQADAKRKRGDSQEGWKPWCPSLLCARAASAHVPALRRAQLPAESQRKTLHPSGANPPTAVRVPRSAGAEKSCRPSGTNTPAAVRVPRSAGAEKSCRPERMNRLRGSSAPEGRCRNQTPAPFSECCSELRMLTRS